MWDIPHGSLLHQLGRTRDAEAFGVRALEAALELGDRHSAALSMHNLSETYLAPGALARSGTTATPITWRINEARGLSRGSSLRVVEAFARLVAAEVRIRAQDMDLADAELTLVARHVDQLGLSVLRGDLERLRAVRGEPN